MIRIGKLNAALIQIKIDKREGEELLREHYKLSSEHKPHQEYFVELAKKGQTDTLDRDPVTKEDTKILYDKVSILPELEKLCLGKRYARHRKMC